jgi:hypothetical protein
MNNLMMCDAKLVSVRGQKNEIAKQSFVSSPTYWNSCPFVPFVFKKKEKQRSCYNVDLVLNTKRCH